MSGAFAAVFLSTTSPAMAQRDGRREPPLIPPPELSQRLVPLEGDSGLLFNDGDEPAVVFSDDVVIEDAEWLRLRFRSVGLNGDPARGTGAVLRITSLEDGGVQILDAGSIEQWRNTSAYFNGDAVRIEVIQHPGEPPSRIVYDFAWAGQPVVVPTSQCGPTDDRILSNDPRSARALPVGCTVFMINDANGQFLTAGHCASGGSLDVVQFNVPLSNGNGSLNHPPPEDQYAVDETSIQFLNSGVGQDWCYFGCFPNSITGLTPSQAQGGTYTMANAPPPVSGQPIRITGYGTDSTPPEHNQVQQTQAGPFFAHNNTQLQYQTDTTGGNSGSGVQDDNQLLIIGIHTHGGCQTNGSGANSGTAINHSGLQNALDNPLGVCRPGLAFTYPGGLPEVLDPSGGVAFVVKISAQNGGQPQPGTGVLHYDAGSGFVDTPMNEVSPNVYEAIFPPIQCGTLVRFYVSAETVTGFVINDPIGAPTISHSALSASSLETIFYDDFQTNQGWTVENISLTDGPWERGLPAGDGSRGDPTSDFDGSGACFLTDNVAGNSDVDGGPTRLISPIIDLSGRESVTLSYARWFFNDDNDIDRLDVHASSDGGSTWTQIESAPHQSGWVERIIPLEDFISLTSQVRLRFSATDNPNDSVTEAGLDAFSLSTYSCAGTTQLTDISVAFGTHESGGLAQVVASDDDRYIVRSRFGFTALEPHVTDILVGATTTDPGASQIDLTYEGRLNQTGGTLKLRLRNWSTGTLQQVAQFAIGATEQTFTVDDIAATNRIRLSDGRIELRARASVLVTFSAAGFRNFTDLVEMTVE
jgi:V8-like Glu-specific endopeptidase